MKPKAKGFQFWTLLILSIIVSILMISEIFISRAILKQQHQLVDSQETAQQGPYYKDAWQNLAVSIWKASAQDPELRDLLKTEGVGVHQGAPPSGETTNAAPADPTIPAPSH